MFGNSFSFNSLNKERAFTFDTSKITGKYTNLEALYKANGADKVYQVKGVYISTFSKFDPEAPIVATSKTYINLPPHQLRDVKAILENPDAIKAINSGRCGFKIRPYDSNYNKTCYNAVWCDVSPKNFLDTFETSDDEDDKDDEE